MDATRDFPPSLRSALARFGERLSARFGPRLREVVLFGSQARNEAHEESDVDVLIVVDDLTDEERFDVFRVAYDIDREGPWLGLAPLVYSTAQAADMRARELLLFRDIDRDGMRL